MRTSFTDTNHTINTPVRAFLAGVVPEALEGIGEVPASGQVFVLDYTKGR